MLAEYPTTAVVMVSGPDGAVAARGNLASRACGYVIEPFTSDDLILAVASALRRRELAMESRARRTTLRELAPIRTAPLAAAVAG